MEKYIADARLLIRDQVRSQLATAIELTAAQYDLLVRNGLKKNPWLALGALQAKARLLGLEKLAEQGGDGEPERIVLGGFQEPTPDE